MHKVVELLPLQFRILYRQFLLRVVDLEMLSVEADVPRFLGQFASVLVLFSVFRALGLFMSTVATRDASEAYWAFVWRGEQSLISGTMFIVGLLAVMAWDSIFPDKRDLMIISPLPVAPRTLLLAKVAASASLIGLAVLALNFATGIAWPLVLGSHHQSNWGFVQSFGAYWLTLIACSLFIFCCVLSVQGISALVLPRRVFLGFSGAMQLIAFILIVSVFFFQPSLTTRAGLTSPANHWVLAYSPSFWFFAMFNQLDGSLPAYLASAAQRAWINLALVSLGAASSLLLCYARTMKNTVEQPDLVPGAPRFAWRPHFGSSLHTAIVVFGFRSLTRSRQHRLLFALYLALIVITAFPLVLHGLSGLSSGPLTPGFLISTFVMMTFAIFGLRSVFLRPISLSANWILRMTQLYPSEQYVAATRRVLVFIAAAPIWLLSALLSLSFRPWQQVYTHLAILALVGWLFVEIALIGFYKVPFSCSYLPGKLHVQMVFLNFLILVGIFAMFSAEFELPSLNDPFRCAVMIGSVGAAALGFYLFNRSRALSAIVSFEELPLPPIITLGLSTGASR